MLGILGSSAALVAVLTIGAGRSAGERWKEGGAKRHIILVVTAATMAAMMALPGAALADDVCVSHEGETIADTGREHLLLGPYLPSGSRQQQRGGGGA